MFSRIAAPLALSLAALALVACSEGPPTAGAPTTFDNVCDKANDGKRLAVAGYLRLPDSIDVITDRSGGSASEILVVRLWQDDKYAGTPIGVNFDFGTAANQMDELPRPSYTDDDLKVHLADGGTASYGQRVQISGTVYFPISAMTKDDVDFDCGLNNPLVELSA